MSSRCSSGRRRRLRQTCERQKLHKSAQNIHVSLGSSAVLPKRSFGHSCAHGLDRYLLLKNHQQEDPVDTSWSRVTPVRHSKPITAVLRLKRVKSGAHPHIARMTIAHLSATLLCRLTCLAKDSRLESTDCAHGGQDASVHMWGKV